MQKLTGRVLKVNKYNGLFRVIYLFAESAVKRAVLKGFDLPCIEGDLLSLEGEWTTYRNETEFNACSGERLHPAGAAPGQPSRLLNRYEQLPALEKLAARSRAMLIVHSFLSAKGFLPVQSPTVTGNWVEGRTQAFEVNFYDRKLFLSISNMLFHHILMSRGFTRIYELGKLHRKETPSGKNKLAEFTILDISAAGMQVQEIMSLFEELIRAIHTAMTQENFATLRLIPPPRFETITYSSLLKACNLSTLKGSQFTAVVKKQLMNSDSFVWVTGFEEHTRPFYTKTRDDGYCADCQLWYKGVRYFAAGSDFETDPEIIYRKMAQAGKNPDHYSFYLEFARRGFPPMSGIGMGFEMLLGLLFEDSLTSDMAFFPKFETQFLP